MRKLLSILMMAALPASLAAQEVTLSVSGGDDRLQSLLETASLTRALQNDDASAAQDYVAAARADYRRLLTALYAAGHFGGTISILVDGIEAARLDPLVARSSVGRVELRVTAGPRFTFGRTDIAPLATGTQLPEAFGSGQTAESAVIGEAASAAISGWRDVGRPLATLAREDITARHPDQTLDVSLTIDPGPELTFGTITVEGNSAVRTERILAIAGLTPHTFDPAELDKAEANLRRTGAFTSAAVLEAEAEVDGTLPLTISVAEHEPRRVGTGIEYSTVTGLTLSGFWLHRNLMGGAERFRVDGEITGLAGGTGGIDYILGAQFLRPATFRPDTDFYTNANISQLDEPAFFQRDVSAEAGVIRRIGSDVELQFGLGFAVGEVKDDVSERSYSLLYLPIEGTIDERDNEFNPTSGYYANLTISPFLGLNETDNGARIVGDGRVYRSFGPQDLVTVAARGQIGSLLGADPAGVPASYLFYSGGGGTVRGQPYKSLSVDLGGGVETGGTSFFATQLEARVSVTDSFSVVGFYDAGFVGSDDLPFDNGQWHSGAGLGVRYNTGIGPIRLDVATPTSGEKVGERVEVYIGIGQAF